MTQTVTRREKMKKIVAIVLAAGLLGLGCEAAPPSPVDAGAPVVVVDAASEAAQPTPEAGPTAAAVSSAPAEVAAAPSTSAPAVSASAAAPAKR